MKNSLKITFAYLAAVIGAGFASGSEIMYYFVRYGFYGFTGIILSSICLGALAYFLLYYSKKHECSGFEELSEKLFGKNIAKVFDVLLGVFMLILLAGMISAFAEMLSGFAGVPKVFSALGFCIICCCIIMLPPQKIIRWGGISGIFIVVLICICCVYMISHRAVKVFSVRESVVSSVVFTAYNGFAVCPVICSWSDNLKSKKECGMVGFFSGIFSFIVLVMLWLLISLFYGKINLGELPMLTLASRHGSAFFWIYTVVIFVSVLSSAVANGYGVYLKLENLKIDRSVKIVLILSVGWLLSSIGFSRIVEHMYRYVGYSVFVIILIILIKMLKKAINRR